jgi:ATP-dependent DNA helicase RecG
MQFSELETIIKSGEDSKHQFKENFTNANGFSANSREEIVRLTQNLVIVHADEILIPDTSEKNIDTLYFSSFFTEKYGNAPGDLDISFKKLLENIRLLKGENLNLAGVLLFAKQPQIILPSFIIKAVVFNGTDVTETNYLDSRDISGKLEEQFNGALSFLINNTKTFQGEQSVNSIGVPEIPKIVFEELVANAIIHRDYFTSASIRILIFNNRIEIINPGHLPNNLTVENILFGNSNIRNPVIASFAAKILPYRGLGSGILRSIKAYPKIEFKDDRDGNLFVAKVCRQYL